MITYLIMKAQSKGHCLMLKAWLFPSDTGQILRESHHIYKQDLIVLTRREFAPNRKTTHCFVSKVYKFSAWKIQQVSSKTTWESHFRLHFVQRKPQGNVTPILIREKVWQSTKSYLVLNQQREKMSMQIKALDSSKSDRLFQGQLWQSNSPLKERMRKKRLSHKWVIRKKLESEQIPKGHMQLVYQFRTCSSRDTESLRASQHFSMKLHSWFTSDWNWLGIQRTWVSSPL